MDDGEEFALTDVSVVLSECKRIIIKIRFVFWNFVNFQFYFSVISKTYMNADKKVLYLFIPYFSYSVHPFHFEKNKKFRRKMRTKSVWNRPILHERTLNYFNCRFNVEPDNIPVIYYVIWSRFRFRIDFSTYTIHTGDYFLENILQILRNCIRNVTRNNSWSFQWQFV